MNEMSNAVHRHLEGTCRGYSIKKEVCYNKDGPGIPDEITVGYYEEDGSTCGEFCFSWRQTGTCELKAYDDSWVALAMMPDLLSALADVKPATKEKDNTRSCITVQQVVQALNSLGFKDRTEREEPGSKEIVFDDAEEVADVLVDEMAALGFVNTAYFTLAHRAGDRKAPLCVSGKVRKDGERRYYSLHIYNKLASNGEGNGYLVDAEDDSRHSLILVLKNAQEKAKEEWQGASKQALRT